MGCKVELKLDPVDKILMKRSLQDNGPAQKFLAFEVRRLCDPYVPMLSGVMKNTAQVLPDGVLYPQVYSAPQYYKNAGNGLRGKEWDKRMIADHGHDLTESVAKYAGGKAK